MNGLGVHLMLELNQCNEKLLNDLAYVRQAMVKAAEAVGAHVIGESFHQFSPQGVTGILAISESHLCIHTWPEYGYAAADIFTCGANIEPQRAAQVLIDEFHSKQPALTELHRGIVTQPAVSS